MGRAPPSEEKQRDDVRTLHEAYQFLCRRYTSSSQREDSEDNAISPMMMLDQKAINIADIPDPGDDLERKCDNEKEDDQKSMPSTFIEKNLDEILRNSDNEEETSNEPPSN